jgi:acetylornithine deacetylase/succinyl-diaminopimelate desuccinylase-like protein
MRADAETATRPPVRIEVQERFDAAGVPAYRGDHAAVYRHIDEHGDAHLAALLRWLRQPSVSAQDQGIAQMAGLLRADLEALGFQETAIVPTRGHPGVFGFHDAGAPKTLAIYMMYDVQPVEPADWRVPPFAAELVELETGSAVMARGATNQKGPERALLNAVESIRAAGAPLPVNLLVLAEGEEELGSPHLPELIARYRDRLQRTIGVLFPSNSQNQKGDPRMSLGVKGIVYFELEARGGAAGGPTRAEIHGSNKAIADSPALRLIEAIASLVSPDGNTILVPGYYDAIRPPSPEEQRLFNGMLAGFDEPALRKQYAVERWIGGMDARETAYRLLFDTTLNVDGIWSGYTGPGTKTILPHKATAKLDSRLVPDQRPERALALIRAHLDAHGFSDLELRDLGSYPPAQVSVETPLVRRALGVFNKYGRTPSVAPRVAGSAPYYVFTETVGVPVVSAGLGHGAGAHAPDEYMVVRPVPGSRIASLAEIEKFYVDLLFALAQ